MNTNPILVDSVPFLRQVECDHVHYECRDQMSYGTLYFWKVCLKCGYEWDASYQDGW